MIELKNVSYTYPNGRKALDKVSFHALHGEKVFVAGKTGSGKSTMLRILNGLIPNFYGGRLDGDVRVYGEKPGVKRVFFVSQHPEEQILCDRVIDEIVFPLLQRGWSWKDAVNAAEWAAKRCGIEHLLERCTSELSEGEKQLVVISTAIASDAECIVLDEPFSHLYPETALKLLRKITKTDRTVIASEHRLEMSEQFDRVFWLGDETLETDVKVSDGNGSKGEERSTSDDVAIEAELTIGYDEPLTSVSLEVARGEIHAIVGPNGSGKTTLLKTIAGILKPIEGKVKVKGKVSMAFQYPNYHFSAKSVEREVSPEMLRLFGLTHLSNRHPHALSGGEAKRVSIAKAFAGDVVLLDEPTAGQDYEFRSRLLRIARKTDKTVIIATHDLKLASMCDGVIELC
ncbi:ABC transporter ATP-binding protein [Archaeoglobus veneficus]|uniref:ABC transporter related protein n=1 Tax=Archaeoglobus veneficus (strain DSM 11195 / SNP6) TaxID=693661 RepID=F2KNQ7_ARCVS|nr:ABC transporter ATP-binding protein [Archaeoglobus veneficus]AEA46285.1 ABC transporter related protein [Archaeoglobus veneficus SNP6]